MDINKAQRCLRLMEDVVDDEEAMESEELPMTQVPDGVTSDEDVFISTQIQGRIDEAERQENMKKSLNKFALTASPAKSPKKAKLDKVKVARPSRRKKRATSRIKSITQFNTENFDNSKDQLRTRELVSLLSGKKGKVKDILNRLEKQDLRKEPSKFCTYNREEWQHILSLLRDRFPHCERSEVRAVHRYIYGEDTDVWYSSQYAPSQQEAGIASEPDMELVSKHWQSPLVFSLSQVMECGSTEEKSDHKDQNTRVTDTEKGENTQWEIGLPIEDSNSILIGKDEPPHKSNDCLRTTNSSKIENTQWEPASPIKDHSMISNSADELGSEIEIDQNVALEFKGKMLEGNAEHIPIPCPLESSAQNSNTPSTFLSSRIPPLQPELRPSSQRFQSFQSIAKSFYTQSPQISPPKKNAADELIDLTQESFRAVKSLISPLKHEVQVPATRYPTLTEDLMEKCNQKSPTMEQSSQETLQFKLFDKSLDVYKSSSWSGFSAHFIESKDFIEDSEEEKGYNIIDLELHKPNRLALEHEGKHSPQSCTESEAETELYPSPMVKSPSQRPSLPPSAQQMRQSLRSIGLKPGRTRQHMLQQMEAVSQNLTADTEEEKRKEIFVQFTSLVEQMPELLEKVYTFEPLVFSDLMRILVNKNPFIDNVEESVVREWADQMGICLRSG